MAKIIFLLLVWNDGIPKQRTTNTIEDALPAGRGKDDC